MKTKTKVKTQAKTDYVTGKYTGSERGFGFVVSQDHADVFIPAGSSHGALHGDEVKCKIVPKRSAPRSATRNGLLSGQVTEILQRQTHMGTYQTEGGVGFVRPMENKIPFTLAVPENSVKRFGLADGHIVMFSMHKKPKTTGPQDLCFITEVIGHSDDPGIDVLTLVKKAGIPYEFSDEAVKEVEEIVELVELRI